MKCSLCKRSVKKLYGEICKDCKTKFDNIPSCKISLDLNKIVKKVVYELKVK